MPLSIRPITQFFKPSHIIGVLLALVLLLPGCSTVKLGYNNAPELSYWWLDSYLDFDDAQSLKVRADLAELQARHRSQELPTYVNTLEKLQRLAPASVTPEQVCDVLAEVRSHVQTLIDQAAPSVIALAPTLRAEQLDHLARQLNKRRQKWREEWLDGSPAERGARRVKQLTERADMFYGRLEEPQLNVLRAHVAASTFDPTLSLRESLRRHQDLLQTLRLLQAGGLSALRARAEVLAMLGRASNSPDAAFRSYLERMNQDNCKAFAALHNSTTPAQRRKALAALKDYETDARALMAAGR